MKQITILKAKTQLSKLLKLVEEGEEVIISRGNHPVAVLSKYQPKKRKRVGEQWKGQVKMHDDFDAYDDQVKQLFEKDL